MKNKHQNHRIYLLAAFLMLSLLFVGGFSGHSLAQCSLTPEQEATLSEEQQEAYLLNNCGLTPQQLAQSQATYLDLNTIHPCTYRALVYDEYEERYGEQMLYQPEEHDIITRDLPIPPLCCPRNNRSCFTRTGADGERCSCDNPPECMYEERRNRMIEMRAWHDRYLAGERAKLGVWSSQPVSFSTSGASSGSAGDEAEYSECPGYYGSTSAAPPDLTGGHALNVNGHIDGVWVGGLKRMTRQMSATMMQQAMAIGTFIDARQQLRTQQVLQELTADAHADYHPDTAMCVFGTNVRSLAATDAIASANAALMNEVLMQREVLRSQTANPSLASSFGPSADYALRYSQFKTTYCNPEDYGGELSDICDVAVPSADNPSRINMDIDFTHNFDLPYTLDIDFTDSVITPDEEDILALSRNLFGSRIFTPIPQDLINQAQTVNNFTNFRAVHAVRSVSRNSFTKLVGMKAKGNASTQSYLRAIVSTLGGQENSGGSVNALLTDAELEELVATNPSYFAQMEILTSKLYQNPSFYVNLYTSPENVTRAGVALKAFELMQDRDRYESALRREMFVAMLVEMNLRDEQVNLNNEIFGSISDLVRSPLAR